MITPETLRSAFYDSVVPSSLVDLDATILDVNEAYCRLMGTTREELVGKREEDVVPTIEPKLDLRTLPTTLGSWTRKRTLKRNESETVIYSVATLLADGKQVLIQAHDITSYEKQLHHQQEELERFTYISSHDLREPLNTIAGLATLLLRRRKDLDGEATQWLDTLIQVAKQMEHKLDDLLKLSRAGKDTSLGIFSFGAAIEEAERSLVRKIKESGAVITLESPSPEMYGSRSLIAQVLQNLFSNSIKYRRDEPPQIRIKTTPYERDSRYWLVSVEDNGLGFDMEFKERIFGVFQRLYTVQQYPGTGIGLAIARKIIERHGGQIWVESIPNQGTTFFFTLPVAK